MPYITRNYSQNVVHLTDVRISNWKVMALVNVDAENRKLSVAQSDYISYYNTCQRLSYIVAKTVNDSSEKGDDEDSIIDRLKGIVPNPNDLSNRVASIGVCTLTVFYNVEGDDNPEAYMIIHHRGNKVAEAMNTRSLVPAGGLQINNAKTHKNYETTIDETSIVNNTVREFEEEVMGRPEVIEPAEYDYVENSHLCESFMKIYYCTMGYDPLSLKVEMITFLAIDCHNTDFERYVYEMKPSLLLEDEKDKTDGFINRSGLKKIVTQGIADEGRITIDRFSDEMVCRYENDVGAMPVMRECMRYVHKYRSKISEIVNGQFPGI